MLMCRDDIHIAAQTSAHQIDLVTLWKHGSGPQC